MNNLKICVESELVIVVKINVVMATNKITSLSAILLT